MCSSDLGSSSSAAGKPLSRKSSAVGMIATRAPTSSISLPWDEALYQKLKEDNDSELESIQKEEDDAVEKAGDVEVAAARGKRAEFWAKVGDKVRVAQFRSNPPNSLLTLPIHRRKQTPPTKTYSRRPAFSGPRSTSC